MRATLLFSLLSCALPACSPVMRAVQLDIRSSLPPVEVYDVAVPSLKDRPTLLVAREVLDGWNFLYLHISDTEFALCLEGAKENGRIVITGFRLAHVLVSSINHIAYVPCPGTEYIGTAHNHPVDEVGSDPCHHSPADQRTFQRDTRAKVDIVICGRDRFVWVMKDGKGPRLRQAAR
jgi:hypothetical protein